MFGILAAVAVVGVMLVCAGCDSAEKRIAKAEQQLDAGDYQKAIDELGNLVTFGYHPDEDTSYYISDVQDAADIANYATAQLSLSGSVPSYQQALLYFNHAGGYRDSAQKAAEAAPLAKEEQYQTAVSEMSFPLDDADAVDRITDAANTFRSIGDYKDSAALFEKCKDLVAQAETIKEQNAEAAAAAQAAAAQAAAEAQAAADQAAAEAQAAAAQAQQAADSIAMAKKNIVGTWLRGEMTQQYNSADYSQYYFPTRIGDTLIFSADGGVEVRNGASVDIGTYFFEDNNLVIRLPDGWGGFMDTKCSVSMDNETEMSLTQTEYAAGVNYLPTKFTKK